MPEHDTGRIPNRREWARVDADAVLAHNFFHDRQLAFLDECARHARGPVVLGMDDLLTDLPPGNPYAATAYPDIARRIETAASRCDRLVVSTEALAEAYGRFASDVRVIPNALDAARWEGLVNRPRDHGKPRIGWAGARQHRDDLLLLLPVIEATWHQFDWVFLGMCPDELRPMACEVHPMVPVAHFPARLAALELDVAVAPLADNAFNRAKSGLKVLEYGMLGLPVVASDLEPYRAAPVTRVGTRASEWIDALQALAHDRPHARREGAHLHDYVLRHGTLAATRGLWHDALTSNPPKTAA
jgi:glycosyltransferase involved in cell wall biosynthesis